MFDIGEDLQELLLLPPLFLNKGITLVVKS